MRCASHTYLPSIPAGTSSCGAPDVSVALSTSASAINCGVRSMTTRRQGHETCGECYGM